MVYKGFVKMTASNILPDENVDFIYCFECPTRYICKQCTFYSLWYLQQITKHI